MCMTKRSFSKQKPSFLTSPSMSFKSSRSDSKPQEAILFCLKQWFRHHSFCTLHNPAMVLSRTFSSTQRCCWNVNGLPHCFTTVWETGSLFFLFFFVVWLPAWTYNPLLNVTEIMSCGEMCFNQRRGLYKMGLCVLCKQREINTGLKIYCFMRAFSHTVLVWNQIMSSELSSCHLVMTTFDWS